MKSNQYIIRLLLVLLAMISLAGCSSSLDAASKIGKILMDPSIPVGALDERPSTLYLSLLAENDMNKNDEGEASPLQIQVIYLTEDSKLLESYYEQFLEEKLDEVLGKNYIDHQDYAVTPGQYKVVPDIKITDKNRYLGVIAYYSDPEKAQWRKVIKLEGMGHHYNVLIHLRKLEVEIKEYE